MTLGDCPSRAAPERRVARAVLAAGLGLLAVAIAFGVTNATRTLIGSNAISPATFVAILEPGGVLCQAGERVPEGTGLLRMTIGTYGAPGPALRVAVQDGDRPVLPVGDLAAGWRQGIVDLPLGATTTRAVPSARVCIANRGTARLAFAGAETGTPARVAGKPGRGRARIEYVLGKRLSGHSLRATIASRMTFARGLWGGLAPGAALAFVLLVVVAATRALLSAHDEKREPT